MADPLFCWKCGTPLQDLPLPLSRTAACRACGAEIHVCRMCLSYRPRWREWCGEDQAEPPRTADRANFCDYFKPDPQAHTANDDRATRAAHAQLEALFSGNAHEAAPDVDQHASPDGDAARRALDDLFKK